MNTPEADSWHQAMEQEMSMMYKRKVWVLVEKTDNMKLVGNRWVYNIKRDQDNNTIYKARLVAQGFLQRRGETYDEVFSPVVNFSVIRFFFSIFVSYLNWEHYQLDVKAAYLYADLDAEIYMLQPQGFKEKSKPEHVCKLQKALYGLHQSGRQWFFEIHNRLKELGFVNLKWVNCVYVLKNEVVLLLYVDDIVLLARTKIILNQVIAIIKSNFDVKELGPTRKLLGVIFEDKKLRIHQSDYINKVYNLYSEKFKIPIVSLPVSKGTVISKTQCPSTEEEQALMKSIPYRNLIGNLSFIASRTRPDVSYVVNQLSRMQANPSPIHWDILLKTLGYLKATSEDCLDLSKVDDLKITCYSDASYADNLEDRTSTSGYIVYLGSSPISWKTAKQNFVSLSTMESEFVALTEASKELSWFTRMLDECKAKSLLSNNDLFSAILKCDNEAAIFYANSPIENSRTKHISVKYHFVRDLISDKIFKLEHVRSKDNLADIFTKAPTKNDLYKFKSKIFSNLKI